MANLTQQIFKQLQLISVSGITEDGIVITQLDKSTAWCKAIRFGKYEEKFTAARDEEGRIKKGSIRFYE
jgi:hypothetical protein